LFKKKVKFCIVSLITLLLAIAFLLASFNFDFTALIDSIADINYGIFAMIACPLLVLLLSGVSYKKQ
jgi:polyferredoxin